MAEAQEDLDKIKQLFMKAPILVPPMEHEPLLLYIAVMMQVVSAVIIVEWEEGHALKI